MRDEIYNQPQSRLQVGTLKASRLQAETNGMKYITIHKADYKSEHLKHLGCKPRRTAGDTGEGKIFFCFHKINSEKIIYNF